MSIYIWMQLCCSSLTDQCVESKHHMSLPPLLICISSEYHQYVIPLFSILSTPPIIARFLFCVAQLAAQCAAMTHRVLT